MFCLVHSWVPVGRAKAVVEPKGHAALPADFETLPVTAQLAAVRPILSSLGVTGEIWNIQLQRRERHVVVVVNYPGSETTVNFDLAAATATLAKREPGIWSALVYLHKTPGPHLVALRGNSAFMHVWRWLADATVYLLLFVTASGVYLWAVLRAERKIGVTLLALGAASFGGLVYAVV